MTGTFAGGIFSSALHLEQPKLPGPINLQLMGMLSLIAGIVLSFALAALVRKLQGNRAIRFVFIAWFVFAWLGINNAIEASVFTTIGGGLSAAVTMLFSAVFIAGALALMFGGHETAISFFSEVHRFFVHRTIVQWVYRLLVAVLAFPVIYFIFGTPAGMIVDKFYRNQEFALQLPSSMVLLFGIQCFRGLVALLAALPLLVPWTDSRQRFIATFGLNLFAVSGLYGLLQAYWMPWTMRSVHTVELLFDSLAYAGMLALLLLPRPPADGFAPTKKAKLQQYDI
jgi:hypothetical protein